MAYGHGLLKWKKNVPFVGEHIPPSRRQQRGGIGQGSMATSRQVMSGEESDLCCRQIHRCCCTIAVLNEQRTRGRFATWPVLYQYLIYGRGIWR